MISRVSLLALLVALLVGSSIAVDSLRHNRIEVRENPKDIGTRFFEQEVKPKVDLELADNDNTIRRHYVVERNYYNVWVTQTVFVLLARFFGKNVEDFRDQQTADKALSDEQAYAAAWAMYETRHYLRVKIRQREELRTCMVPLVALLRARDKYEYKSPDGPSWDWILARKLKKYNLQPLEKDQVLDKRASLEIMFSAASPNDLVNSFIEWVASKTGGTMTLTEMENLMTNAGITKEEVKKLTQSMESSTCPRVKSSDKLPNENLVLEYALSNPSKKEIPDSEVPLLVRVPSSDNLSPPQSPTGKKGTGPK